MKALVRVIPVLLITLALLAVSSALAQEGPSGVEANPQLAVVHLAPFAPDPDTAVSVEFDGNEILNDFSFGDAVGYREVTSGSHLIEIFPAGSTEPALSETVVLSDDTYYTAVAVGGANEWDLDLLLLEDDMTAPPAGYAKVRIGHLAPLAADVQYTLVDVRLQDGTLIFDDVPYGEIKDYLELEEGTHDLKITNDYGSRTLIDLMPVDLMDGDTLSVFVVGEWENQPLGGFALPMGQEGSLLPLAASLQVAHLAPFAADPDTAVSVELDGVEILDGFEYADSTGYLPVEAGVDHLVEIYPVGSATPAISATVNLTQAKGYAAVAVGGANGWDLDLRLLEEDMIAPPEDYAKVRLGHLAPFAADEAGTLADVRLQDGTVILYNVPYGTVAYYQEWIEATYDLLITTDDGSTTLIDPLPVAFNAGDNLWVFAIGDLTNQPAGVFALPVGEPGYLLPERYMLYLPLVLGGFPQ